MVVYLFQGNVDEDEIAVQIQKTKLKTGLGCLFILFGFGILILFVVIRLFFFFSEEKMLESSDSPNQIHSIEVVLDKKNTLHHPIVRINYEDQSIEITKIPDRITIDWYNDYEADVILSTYGYEPKIVKIQFN